MLEWIKNMFGNKQKENLNEEIWGKSIEDYDGAGHEELKKVYREIKVLKTELNTKYSANLKILSESNPAESRKLKRKLSDLIGDIEKVRDQNPLTDKRIIVSIQQEIKFLKNRKEIF